MDEERVTMEKLHAACLFSGYPLSSICCYLPLYTLISRKNDKPKHRTERNHSAFRQKSTNLSPCLVVYVQVILKHPLHIPGKGKHVLTYLNGNEDLFWSNAQISCQAYKESWFHSLEPPLSQCSVSAVICFTS